MSNTNSTLPCAHCDGVTAHMPQCIGVMLDASRAEVEAIQQRLDATLASLESMNELVDAALAGRGPDARGPFSAANLAALEGDAVVMAGSPRTVADAQAHHDSTRCTCCYDVPDLQAEVARLKALPSTILAALESHDLRDNEVLRETRRLCRAAVGDAPKRTIIDVIEDMRTDLEQKRLRGLLEAVDGVRREMGGRRLEGALQVALDDLAAARKEWP